MNLLLYLISDPANDLTRHGNNPPDAHGNDPPNVFTQGG